MYWLRQPPYLRWIAAGLVLLLGLYFDTRPAAVVTYPFVAESVVAGQSVADTIHWREVPAGFLPDWGGVVDGYAVADLTADTPLVPGLVTEVSIPRGWWAVALSLPRRVTPGTAVRVVVGDNVVDGLLIDEPSDNGFEVIGSVAFAPDQATRVAAASADDALVVMIGTGGPANSSAG